MKATDLMVGDFVIDDGVRTRIDEMDFVLNSDKLSPVPLSEEILVKSEFVKTGSTDEVCYRYSNGTDDYYSRVEIRPRKDNEFFVRAEKYATGFIKSRYSREFKGRILFLHELQHILKLIGIEKEVKI